MSRLRSQLDFKRVIKSIKWDTQVNYSEDTSVTFKRRETKSENPSTSTRSSDPLPGAAEQVPSKQGKQAASGPWLPPPAPRGRLRHTNCDVMWCNVANCSAGKVKGEGEGLKCELEKHSIYSCLELDQAVQGRSVFWAPYALCSAFH